MDSDPYSPWLDADEEEDDTGEWVDHTIPHPYTTITPSKYFDGLSEEDRVKMDSIAAIADVDRSLLLNPAAWDEYLRSIRLFFGHQKKIYNASRWMGYHFSPSLGEEGWTPEAQKALFWPNVDSRSGLDKISQLREHLPDNEKDATIVILRTSTSGRRNIKLVVTISFGTENKHYVIDDKRAKVLCVILYEWKFDMLVVNIGGEPGTWKKSVFPFMKPRSELKLDPYVGEMLFKSEESEREERERRERERRERDERWLVVNPESEGFPTHFVIEEQEEQDNDNEAFLF
jgi:hypothetical protein